MEIAPEDIRTIYILVLKNNIKTYEIPIFWLSFQMLTKEIGFDYKSLPFPRFVELLMRYGI